MINYILQVILFQVLFLAIYDFFLSKETFFTKNRWYLLSTPIVSFLIPLIKIPTFQKTVSQEFFIQLPEIVLNPDKVIQEKVTTSNLTTSTNYINILFWIGVALFSVLFLIKLIKIITFISKNETIKKSNFILILIPNQTKAFSFFKYIFLGKEVPKHQQEKVIQHELVHSQQKHSLDLLLFEILKIVMWFNPMIYFYQKRITLVHEYISDAVVSKSETKESYINNLLSNFFQVENIMFVNQFCKKSLVKKRILMINKQQSRNMNQLKYLVLVPVFVGMLFYSSCSNEEDNFDFSEVNKTSKKEYQKRYMELSGEIIEGVSGNKTYLDRYIGRGIPEGIEVSYDDLTNEEREEYDTTFERMKSVANDEFSMVKTLKIFEKTNGRKTLAIILKDSKDIKVKSQKKEPLSDGSYSVLHVQKTPTFAGCEVRDLDCFFKSLEEHFKTNFNINLANNLGLSSGTKKAFVSFNIDLAGKVSDLKVRAPHKSIEKEVKRVLYKLPKMTIGKIDDKPVKVRYTLPFVFNIE